VGELGAALELTDEDVLEALQAGRGRWATSLATPAGAEGEDELGDHLGCGDHGFELAEHRAVLERLLCALNDREREVVRLRFEEDLTQEEIGALVGISQMHVSRLLRQALQKLRLEAATVRR
jgi:RNA polymerase sigma-B factor